MRSTGYVQDRCVTTTGTPTVPVAGAGRRRDATTSIRSRSRLRVSGGGGDELDAAIAGMEIDRLLARPPTRRNGPGGGAPVSAAPPPSQDDNTNTNNRGENKNKNNDDDDNSNVVRGRVDAKNPSAAPSSRGGTAGGVDTVHAPARKVGSTAAGAARGGSGTHPGSGNSGGGSRRRKIVNGRTADTTTTATSSSTGSCSPPGPLRRPYSESTASLGNDARQRSQTNQQHGTEGSSVLDRSNQQDALHRWYQCTVGTYQGTGCLVNMKGPK